ncbi:MAG: signal recognition particle-docking protein FtsY [Alcaligenaceae bacterium]|nr:signal recognition particle-docking protein FtsY [Alcaligenaceae bacterium]
MFSFFRRKKPESLPAEAPGQQPDEAQVDDAPSAGPAPVADSARLPDAQASSAPPAETVGLQPVVSEVARPGPEPVAPETAGAASIPAPEAPSAPAAEPVAEVPVTADADVPEPAAATADEPVAAAPAAEAVVKKSWLSRLKQGLSRTGQSIGGIFVGVKVDEDLFEELETALIMADAGMEATEKLLAALRARVKKDKLTDSQAVKAALQAILAEHLEPLEKTFPLNSAKPLVVMIAGVNGAGKTTSIGKLAHAFQAQGASVLLAAADTFRAAAREQLMEWGARNNVTVVAQEGGDPAAVAFDAVNAGRARQAGVVMVDTAGRLPTQLHLMEELKKIKRVVGKADGEAPHEVLLVVDGNTGQNAISQVKAFDAAIGLTGLIVTKLDGTAKGGALAALAAGSQGVRPIPVYWIGVGEGMHDLQPFVAREFSSALLGD